MLVAMPTGSAHGWGIAGVHLIEGISAHPLVPGVTLHSMGNPDFKPTLPDLWNRANVGYCFFENDIEAYRYMQQAAEQYDFIVAGSSWCEYHLRTGGIANTSTILQGINPRYFYPGPSRREDGRFIVFSGGKFELRKSQDVVIAALRVFMERHRDVWLSCAWHNQWPASVATMNGSPCIDFVMEERPCDEIVAATLARNGIDRSRVIQHPMRHNTTMREVYLESDIGLFPNRCEGGNNMVMCEYMACGRTVVASNKSGHGDVITADNAFALEQYGMKMIERNGQPSALWFEPSVDEVVERLEYAYGHREELALRSQQAAASMQKLDWSAAAGQFYEIACRVAPAGVAPRADDCLYRANRLCEIGRQDMAEHELRQAMALAPLDRRVFAAMGTLLAAAGRDAEAELYRSKAEQLVTFSGQRG